MNTKRKILLAAMFFAAVCVLHAQARPRLGILPFTGGGGADGDTIAMLLGNEPDLTRAFTLVPRTAAVNAIAREHRFQNSGHDESIMAELGRQMGVDYVVTGHIQQLARSRQVHITMIHVGTRRQVARGFWEYSDLSAVRAMALPIVRMIAGAAGQGGGQLPWVAGEAGQQGGGRLPTLAILPFTGDNYEDATTLAVFFSYEGEIQRNFTVVPRIPDHIQGIMREHQFQRSGLTDSDTIAELGRQMNADYVLAGHITSLGTGADRSNLLLITIIHVEEFRQAAGDYREFQRIEQTVYFLPAMAGRIAAAVRQDASRLRRLAVLPFNPLTSGIDERDAEVLAQILATNIANSGRFAVFPRTRSIEAVMAEHNIQRGGMTDQNSIRRIGEAVNAQYVLSASARRLGADSFFSASVLHIAGANQQVGSWQRYQNVSDGLSLMSVLARELVADRMGTNCRNIPVESLAWFEMVEFNTHKKLRARFLL